MTMSSFSSKTVHERSKNSDADVRLELTRMIFDRRVPHIWRLHRQMWDRPSQP
jgi:hypothetical protein